MAFQERYYQSEAVEAFQKHLMEKNTHPLVVVPTGGGKTPIMSRIIGDEIKSDPTSRIGVISHQKELLEQGYRTLYNHMPSASLGIHSAGLGKSSTDAQIMFMGIQSVHRKVDILGDFDIFLVDEAHLIPRNADTMYGRFIAEMHDKVPHLRVGGFTATPYRTDSGRLDDGEGAIFDEVCYEIGTGTLINQGYLCPLITKNTETKLDITGVGKSGGEFKSKQLQEAVDEYEISKAACEEIVAYGRQQMRRSWVVFASGVNHANNVTEILQDMGVNAVCLTGETTNAVRDDYLRRFKNYQIECIVNVGVLTTGFDHPGVDLIAMLNPTASTGRYVQICGRGLRVIYPKGFNSETCSHEERAQAIMGSIKPNCTVLDFAGNILRHGPIDDIHVRPKGVRETSEDAIAPTKICPTEGCDTIVAANARTCPDCGHEWEINEKPKHDTVASDAAIMKSAHNIPTVLWTQVKSVSYEIWRKPGQKESLRVSYETLGYGDVTEWIAVEAIGTRRRIAEKWWGQVSGKDRETCPKTTKEVFDLLPELVDITTVAVEKNGKYWNAIARRAEGDSYVAAYKLCPACGVILPKADQCSCNSKGEKENENWLNLN